MVPSDSDSDVGRCVMERKIKFSVLSLYCHDGEVETQHNNLLLIF